MLRVYNAPRYRHMWLRDPATNHRVFFYPALPSTEYSFVQVRSAFILFCCILSFISLCVQGSVMADRLLA